MNCLPSQRPHHIRHSRGLQLYLDSVVFKASEGTNAENLLHATVAENLSLQTQDGALIYVIFISVTHARRRYMKIRDEGIDTS